MANRLITSQTVVNEFLTIFARELGCSRYEALVMLADGLQSPQAGDVPANLESHHGESVQGEKAKAKKAEAKP